MDLLSEMYFSNSNYNYALNNPLKYIDPTGMKVTETDSSYVITGDDIQTYISNLQLLESGNSGNTFQDLQQSLGDAAKGSKPENAGNKIGNRLESIVASSQGDWTDTYNFNRIGFVPLDEKVGYQMANYRMNFRANTSMVPTIGKDYSIPGQQRVLTISAISRTTLVSGDVSASASATLMINGNTISSRSLLPSGTNLVNAGSYYIGSVSFNIPNSGNIQVGLQGGWVVTDPGGRSVPVYHPIGAPIPININTTITIPGL